MWSAAAILACAVNLLGRTADLPRIEFVSVPPSDVSRSAEAFTRENSDTIYVITSSEVFRTAQEARSECGDFDSLRKLASIIVHESWHVHHGPDEQHAYEAQLIALISLGVTPGMPVYNSVMHAKLAVRKAQKASRSPQSLQALSQRPSTP
jgi:hypothetical protein